MSMPAITKDGARPQRFTKKPVTIEAIRYTGSGNFANPALPEWMWKALETGAAFNREGNLIIQTIEGEMGAEPGDWIIQGVKGEIYPCKPDIFAMTYTTEHITDTAATHAAPKAKEKIAPVQGYAPGIPWSLHLEAYDAYSKKWSPQPALIDLEGRGCRGGFSTEELDNFIPGWRDKVSEIAKLKARIAELECAAAPTDMSAVEVPPLPEAYAWEHTMDNTEGIKSNTPHSVLSYRKSSPFGKAGIDYSKSFPVTKKALFDDEATSNFYREGYAAGVSAALKGRPRMNM